MGKKKKPSRPNPDVPPAVPFTPERYKRILQITEDVMVQAEEEFGTDDLELDAALVILQLRPRKKKYKKGMQFLGIHNPDVTEALLRSWIKEQG